MKRIHALAWSLPMAAAMVSLPAGSTSAQEASTADKVKVVGHAAQQSDQAVSLTLELGSGEEVHIAIDGGTLFINGAPAADLAAGGTLDMALRELATEFGTQSTADAVAAMHDLVDVHVRAEEVDARAAVLSAIEGLSAADALFPELADVPAVIAGRLPSRQVARAPRRSDASVGGNAHVAAAGSSLAGGIVGSLVNLGAVYLAMSFMGLGMLFFAPRQLEVVADTVWHSFGRSFLAGLFAQPLLIPALTTMIVGLALTIVGILVIPFAVVAFLAAFLLAAIGGFVAVARTVGEIYLRRKMAQGVAIKTWGSFRYIVYGLAGLSAIWLPAALMGGIPVAGPLLVGSAALITWVLATAGFGATIISRAGVRGTFVRRLDLALTDEQYWTDEQMPTPYASSDVKRR